jgi:hypothetical protein
METHEVRVSPQELYHAVWRAAWANFYERSRLGGWSHWQHRFDDVMRTDEDAYGCIGEMLSSLHDSYTFLKTPRVVRTDNQTLLDEPSPVVVKMLAGDVGYIHIRTFSHNEVAEEVYRALSKIEHARGFILDLRGNRGGFVIGANNVASMFIDEGPLMVNKTCIDGVFTEKRTFVDDRDIFEVEYDKNGSRIGSKEWKRYRNLTGNKPLYVLTDNATCSASEMVCGILRDNNRATFVGRTTAGKGICQDTFNLPNGCGLRCTNGVYLTPSRHWFGDDGQTCAYGMQPHVYVRLNSDGSDDTFDVAFDRLIRRVHPRSTSGGLLLAGAIGLGLAVLAGTGRGGRRVA